jgi:hypothetical protein
MVFCGFVSNLIFLIIPNLNISIGSTVIWALTFLIMIVIRLIVNIENVSQIVSTNVATNIINENPLIQYNLIAFGIALSLQIIYLILKIWKQFNGNDDTNNDKGSSKPTNKPPNPGPSNLGVLILVIIVNQE